MRRLLPFLPLALLAGCSGLDDLKEGDLYVSTPTLEAAARSPDPTLDAPLMAILERRILQGFTSIDDGRVVQALRALAARDTLAAIPQVEALVFDPSDEVRFQALVTLEELDARASLPVVHAVALAPGRRYVREQAYYTFGSLARERVRFLDEAALDRILEARTGGGGEGG